MCVGGVGVSAPQSFALDLLHDLLQERIQLFRYAFTAVMKQLKLMIEMEIE